MVDNLSTKTDDFRARCTEFVQDRHAGELKPCPFCGAPGRRAPLQLGGAKVECSNEACGCGTVVLYTFEDRWARVISAWNRRQSDEPAAKPIDKDAVEWVVNDIAELGVKIGNQFFFLYKGYSLVYEDAKHDDGSPMQWRPVFKREFGECCHPVNYEDLRKCGHQHLIGTVNLTDSDEWKPLPSFPETKVADHD